MLLLRNLIFFVFAIIVLNFNILISLCSFYVVSCFCSCFMDAKIFCEDFFPYTLHYFCFLQVFLMFVCFAGFFLKYLDYLTVYIWVRSFIWWCFLEDWSIFPKKNSSVFIPGGWQCFCFYSWVGWWGCNSGVAMVGAFVVQPVDFHLTFRLWYRALSFSSACLVLQRPLALWISLCRLSLQSSTISRKSSFLGTLVRERSSYCIRIFSQSSYFSEVSYPLFQRVTVAFHSVSL